MSTTEKKAKPAERDEINRLYAALLNFLTVGYDKEYQQSESAIEQLEKLRGYALKKATEEQHDHQHQN